MGFWSKPLSEMDGNDMRAAAHDWGLRNEQACADLSDTTCGCGCSSPYVEQRHDPDFADLVWRFGTGERDPERQER